MWRLYVKGSWQEISSPSRGELFGDGVFETIHVWRGKCLFLSEHLRRLREGAQVLSLQLPLSIEALEKGLRSLCQAYENARLKLVLYRAGEGTYTPLTSEAYLKVHIAPLQGSFSFPIAPPQRLVIFPSGFTVFTPWSAYKTLSAVGYVQAAAYAKAQGCEEAIILSAEGYLSETSRGNIFFWDGKVLHTPSLRTGCVRGVFRMQVIQAARQLGLPIEEGLYPVEKLSEAEEVFTTNVIQGLAPVIGMKGMSKTFRTGKGTIGEAIGRLLGGIVG